MSWFHGPMAEVYKRDTEMAQRELSDYTMTMLANEPHAKVFRMAGKQSMRRPFYIMATPAGVCIHGDLNFAERGCATGYGLAWFAGKMPAQYMAQNFRLAEGFHYELAEAHVEQAIADIRKDPEGHNLSEERAEEIESAWESREGLCSDVEYMETWTRLLGEDTSDGCPGYGYNSWHVALLAAAQARFRALFWEMFESIEPIEGGGTRLVPKAPATEETEAP